MRLRVVLPAGVFLDAQVARVVAEAPNGSFCLLPRHIDAVAPLVPGVLALTLSDGQERFVAVDQGVLVKCGAEVLVSVRTAVQGPLADLKRRVRGQFDSTDEREHRAHTALSTLEADLVRHVLEWTRQGSA